MDGEITSEVDGSNKYFICCWGIGLENLFGGRGYMPEAAIELK